MDATVVWVCSRRGKLEGIGGALPKIFRRSKSPIVAGHGVHGGVLIDPYYGRPGLDIQSGRAEGKAADRYRAVVQIPTTAVARIGGIIAVLGA